MTPPLYRNDAPGQFPASWYAATATIPDRRPAVSSDLRADVAIVGAGYTGLHAALELRKHGLSVIVLDAHRAGWGASGRNGGQVGSDFNKGQLWLEARVGRDTAKSLWSLAQEAAGMVRDFCTLAAPLAQYKPGIAWGQYDTDLSDIRAEVDHLDRHYPGHGMTALDRDGIQALIRSEKYNGGTLNMQAGHIHPLNYVLALAAAAETAGAVIYEGTEVTRLDTGGRVTLHTPGGRVTADHVILAGNGYIRGLATANDARVMPINSFIGATEPLGDLAEEVLTQDIAACDSSFVVNYFRLTADKRLLFGGRANYSLTFPADMGGELHKRMVEMFPQLAGTRFSHTWGGTLGVTMTRLPYVRAITPNILSAGGYSGHGVALAGLAGRVMAEAVAGQAGRFDTLGQLPVPPFPLGHYAQETMLPLAMTWFTLRDNLGI